MLIYQIELPLLLFALAANFSLLYAVFRYAPKDKARLIFCYFVLAQFFWVSANYYNFHAPKETFLLSVRFTLFFATFHALTFFLFINSFHEKLYKFSKKLTHLVSYAAVMIALLTLTPYIFSELKYTPSGLSPSIGPGMPFFGLFIAFCVGAGFFALLAKYKKAERLQKLQIQYLGLGLFITILLVVVFSFLNFVIFGHTSTVKFGHLYTLPFVIFTSYAMIRHQLLDVKAIAAEIMVVIINLLIAVQLLNSTTPAQWLINSILFVSALSVGILLVRGVLKEVNQRHQLEILSTQLSLANNKLKTLDQARAEFISIASHQLRTPPATVKWYLAAVLAGDFGQLSEDLKTPVKKAFDTNNHLISLIEDMLNVSRIERGKMEFMFEETDVEALAGTAYDQLIPMSIEKKLEFTYKSPSEKLPKIMADKEKLGQVMNNLMDNAIKYTKAGMVSVSIFRNGDAIQFQVTDTGKGIPTGHFEEIFEKFTRGKESIKQSAGLGLGLYVAKVIIDQHKGKIWAESEGENKGSTFIFQLPIHNQLTKTTLLDLTQ